MVYIMSWVTLCVRVQVSDSEDAERRARVTATAMGADHAVNVPRTESTPAKVRMHARVCVCVVSQRAQTTPVVRPTVPMLHLPGSPAHSNETDIKVVNCFGWCKAICLMFDVCRRRRKASSVC
jgi:hypothetical protein